MSDPPTFIGTLTKDVEVAEQRLFDNDTPTNRRELIRAVSAAIEGLHWQLKQDVLHHVDRTVQLSHHEAAAIRDETYTVDDSGVVRTQRRYLPLTTAIRLTIRMVQKYRPEFHVDFGNGGWSDLKDTIEVRNRLVHPKSIDELTVSIDEIRHSLSAMNWVLDLSVEASAETIGHLKELMRQALRREHGENRASKPKDAKS